MKSIEIPYREDRDWRYRLLEILPGALSWGFLIFPVVLSQISPKATAYFVIAYLMLWFIKAITLNIRSLQGTHMMETHKKLPWGDMLNDLEKLEITTHKKLPKWHRQNIERIKGWSQPRIKPSQVVHAVIIAAYNESLEILAPTVEYLLKNDYDPKKVILVFAYEERNGAQSEPAVLELTKKYKHKFMLVLASKHPVIAGEVKGKGGNITYAGRQLKTLLEKEKINPAHVLVTTLDADNRPDKKYLGALTYTFCSTDEPKYVSYQPIPMYTNNIWDAPAPMRVIATGNSFWMVVQSLRQHMLRNFSAHAQPMDALIETDFWSVRTIVEDGHQFWRSYFKFDGKHEVFPIFVPIYQDAVLAEGYRRTLRAQFVQLRRWAWGASDVPYVFTTGFLKKNNVPKLDLTFKFLRLLEGHVNWATAPLILLLAAFIPLLFHPQDFIANQLPPIASRLQRVAMIGLVVTLFLSLRSLPPRPARHRRHRNLYMIAQWIYLPLTGILYNTFSALNAQTRLMFGFHLGQFDVTEKAVKTDTKKPKNSV